MKLNKDKHIGRVLFIVEGSQMEFSVLRRVFCSLLGYNYLQMTYSNNAMRYYLVAFLFCN